MISECYLQVKWVKEEDKILPCSRGNSSKIIIQNTAPFQKPLKSASLSSWKSPFSTAVQHPAQSARCCARGWSLDLDPGSGTRLS